MILTSVLSHLPTGSGASVCGSIRMFIWKHRAIPIYPKYTVNLDIFRVALDNKPTIIVAPPGGGKTAMRVAVTRTCWFDIGGTYPFPLPYNLGMAPLTGKPPTTTQHLRLLLEAGTCALLTGLAFRPERLLRASVRDHSGDCRHSARRFARTTRLLPDYSARNRHSRRIDPAAGTNVCPHCAAAT
jgi:hypothetical protein